MEEKNQNEKEFITKALVLVKDRKINTFEIRNLLDDLKIGELKK